MKIKNGTKLRTIVKGNRGNTSQIDSIEFSSNGEWKTMPHSETSEEAIYKCKIVYLTSKAYHGSSMDQDITAMFQHVEMILDHFNKTGEKLNCHPI